MYLIPMAWIYVALMMAIAEATNSNGSVLGGLMTFVLYGLLPVGLVVYLMGSSGRRKALKAQEAADLAAYRQSLVSSHGPPQEPSHPEAQGLVTPSPETGGSGEPDASRHAATDPVAPVRKEP